MLAAGVATLAFAVAFAVACSVWVMLAALEPALAPRLGLSPVGRELLVAIPLAAGALARFPVGVLTDRCGARVMLAAIGITAAVPLATVAFAGRVEALAAVVVAAAIAGTMYSVGAALVSRANPVGRRGRALGIFGAGTAGAALAGLTSPYLLQTDGPHTVLLLSAGALVVVAVLAVAVVRDRPAASGVPALHAADGTFGIGLTILSAALVTAAAQVRARPEWLNTWPAPPLPVPRPSGTTVVAVAWSDIRRGTPAVAAALAELARRDELLVVHGGATDHARRHPGHNLVAALRDRLPVHRITGMLVDTTAANGDTDLVAELLNEGAVTIAMTPAADPGWAAVVLAEQVGADEVLQVSVARSGTVDLTPLAGTAGRAVPG